MKIKMLRSRLKNITYDPNNLIKFHPSISFEDNLQKKFDKIDHYLILRKLGKGKTGDVYLALNMDNIFEFVSIKVFVSKDQFEKELKCLQKIKAFCGSYVCLIDFFEWNSRYYIVSNYLKGYVPLYEYLAIIRKDQNEAKVKNTIDFVNKQIYDLIVNLHEHGLAHNDLHTNNIMIDPETLDVKFIDFGECQNAPKDEDFEIVMLLSGLE